MRRSQFSVEYLVAAAFMFAMITAGSVVLYQKTRTDTGEAQERQIQHTAELIAAQTHDVYMSPGFAKRTIKANLPETVESIKVENRNLVIGYSSSSGYREIIRDLGVPAVSLIEQDNIGGNRIIIVKAPEHAIICTSEPCACALTETCDNWIDDDCDGLIDLCDPDCCQDVDGDGAVSSVCCVGPPCQCETDCDDNDPLRSPYFQEVCNGRDSNCDGIVDNDPTDCQGDCKQCTGGACLWVPDDPACGEIDCSSMDGYVESGPDGPDGTNYCVYREYENLTSGRCEGGECKEPDETNCVDYTDTDMIGCGRCAFVEHCSDSQRSCGVYPDLTPCGDNAECSSGICTCLFGFEDCDGDGDCECDRSSGEECNEAVCEIPAIPPGCTHQCPAEGLTGCFGGRTYECTNCDADACLDICQTGICWSSTWCTGWEDNEFCAGEDRHLRNRTCYTQQCIGEGWGTSYCGDYVSYENETVPCPDWCEWNDWTCPDPNTARRTGTCYDTSCGYWGGDMQCLISFESVTETVACRNHASCSPGVGCVCDEDWDNCGDFDPAFFDCDCDLCASECSGPYNFGNCVNCMGIPQCMAGATDCIDNDAYICGDCDCDPCREWCLQEDCGEDSCLHPSNCIWSCESESMRRCDLECYDVGCSGGACYNNTYFQQSYNPCNWRSKCEAGQCVCDDGWDDCDGSGICDCDLSYQHCVAVAFPYCADN